MAKRTTERPSDKKDSTLIAIAYDDFINLLAAKRIDLRDRFAMMVLEALLRGDVSPGLSSQDDWALMAYSLADAMMAERQKGK